MSFLRSQIPAEAMLRAALAALATAATFCATVAERRRHLGSMGLYWALAGMCWCFAGYREVRALGLRALVLMEIRASVFSSFDFSLP